MGRYLDERTLAMIASDERRKNDCCGNLKKDSLSSLVSRLASKLFWPALIIAVVAALSLLLWSGRSEGVSYREMACTFEERAPSCLDSIDDWKAGLAYFDSSVAATQDTLNSLKSLLWNFWNIEFAGAGDAAIAKNAVLPLRVLENKKSGCMGLSWLALMVAEARDLRSFCRVMSFYAMNLRTVQRTWNRTVVAIRTRTTNTAKSIKTGVGRALNLTR